MTRDSSRPYRGGDDAIRLQAFTAEAVRRAGQTGFMHPGDVAHRIFSGLRRGDLPRQVRIWEDDDGISAWVMISPKHQGFDLQVRPDRRETDDPLERAALDWAEQRTIELMTELGSTPARTVTDAFEDDGRRIALLEECGWRRGVDPYVLTVRTLDDVPEVATPGYRIRTVHGIDEAEAVGAVHAASFGSTWDPGEYAAVMRTPTYDAERELVAENEAGELCGFTVMWFDHLNGVGLFEPVGVHRHHRRRGLGRALLAAGMERMRRAGLTHAMVAYETGNPASGPLYRAMGFVPTWTLWDYVKTVD